MMKHSRKILILVASILTLALISQAEARGALKTAATGATLSQRSRVKRPAATRKVSSARTGMWGGRHISLDVGTDGARIEYDCAQGTIDQPIRLDRNGRFDVRGTHESKSGGPVRMGAPSRSQPARYVGRVTGSRMTLRVTLVGSGESVGTFSLDYGAEPQIVRCY